MPCSAYNWIKRLALVMVPAVSNDNLASTSVETLPGTIFRMAAPEEESNKGDQQQKEGARDPAKPHEDEQVEQQEDERLGSDFEQRDDEHKSHP